MPSAPTPRRQRHAVVIGGGLAGAATAFHLAGGGEWRVTVLEKEETPGRHASGRSAAMIRQAVGPRAVAAVARASTRSLADAAARGAVAFAPSGSVLLGARQRLESLLADAPQPGISELVAPGAAHALTSGISPARSSWALVTASDGILDVAALLHHYLHAHAAVELRCGVEVLGLERQGARAAAVRTSSGAVACDVVVNAAGAWAASLARACAAADLPLAPLRRHLYHTTPVPWVRRDAPFVWDVDRGFYYRPESQGLLLCACDEDPSEPCDAQVDPAAAEILARKLERLGAPFADLRLARAWAGLRTFAPDRSFVLGWDPVIEGFFWVAGLGGHGVTTSWELGAEAARLIAQGPGARHPDFDPARF
jgi:D-arginine dehydrogenase